jgi:serine/threonine protein kinase
MAADTNFPLQIGQRFGKYHIEALLGAGGMGTVYSARDQVSQRRVAIKVLDRVDAMARISLMHEARIAASLHHPSICGVDEFGYVGDRPFIVMECIDGVALARVINSPQRLSLVSALSYIHQMAAAVAHLHQSGIVHSDLKSANIMIRPDGSVKILDFGLATRQSARDKACVVERSQTEWPSGSGTVPYMAPEIVAGGHPNMRSDVWALGVVMYETMSGLRPFTGATKCEVAAAICHQEPKPLSRRIRLKERGIIERCLLKTPGDRFPSACELASALKVSRNNR